MLEGFGLMAVPIKGRLKDGLGGYVSCTIVETDLLSFLGTISMWWNERNRNLSKVSEEKLLRVFI